ncbi:DUF924 family protein [Acinetobacter tianfuensis]|uniref:DUF924 domain-containing protein n=1 Tax=Acinetobacter tianfuensis TaxID=2419603 RepID=A0A3A8E3D2_9GAMM|nr:DUF924 family protein [Acinetobacter tianfuensis]RKG29582.1 DUF924 domain-containing protein [Acinetobacter tianfuensis]
MNYQDILNFWFSADAQPLWFAKNDDFDASIEKNFQRLHQQAAQAELWPWRQHAAGRLAEIIALDQFSRNLYRGSAQAFAQDPLALALAQECVQQGLDQTLSSEQRLFVYLPFMHSESLPMQEQSLLLFQSLGLAGHLDYAKQHHAIIARFGRFPHRNAVLGRTSSAEELAFLTEPNSSF